MPPSWYPRAAVPRLRRIKPPRLLKPDVLLGDGAVAPFRDGHHPATAFELPDHAGPLSGAEADRVRGNLDRRTTGGLDQSLHRLDVFLDTACGRLPLDLHNHVVGVAVGERTMPVGSVPSVEIELIHSLQIAGYLVTCHDRSLLPGRIPIACPSLSADVRRFTRPHPQGPDRAPVV